MSKFERTSSIKGNKRLTAFVLKGKSYPKVSSKLVAHQFAKLRQISGLGVMILCAVGNIQDDAQRDFVRTAIDANCDYLIIDAHNLARLLIAYEKNCPQDGTTFDESGICKEGHVLDEGLTLEVKVREDIQYTKSLKDVSTNKAKRYTATILLDRHYSKDIIRAVIQEATEGMKHNNYCRNDWVRTRWGQQPAQVVWLFIAHDLDDIHNYNWVCRSCWIDPALPTDARPRGLRGNEQLGDIQIAWHDDYESRKRYFQSVSGTKQEVLETLRLILNEMLPLAQRGIELFGQYHNGSVTESDLIVQMQRMEGRATELYYQSGNIPLPPIDCKDYYEACQSLFATIDDMFLYYSDSSLEKWSQSNRDWLMQDTIRRFDESLRRVRFEEVKIH